MISPSLRRHGRTALAAAAAAALLFSGAWAREPLPAPETRSWKVLGRIPHDPAAFTQGLAFSGGVLLESTGLYGASSLRRIDPETGRVLQKVPLPEKYFGEGATALGGRIYQVTWRSGIGLVYEGRTLRRIGTFAYAGEGWGLTHDGQRLILSDGSDTLRFLDPRTFSPAGALKVRWRGVPVRNLNELEYVDGMIHANVLDSDRIACIDPADGRVREWIDLAGLAERGPAASVLNGIAYDPAGGGYRVTGKLWSWIYRLELAP